MNREIEGPEMGGKLMNYLATKMPSLEKKYGGKWVLLGNNLRPGVLFAHEELEQVQDEARKRGIGKPYIVPISTSTMAVVK